MAHETGGTCPAAHASLQAQPLLPAFLHSHAKAIHVKAADPASQRGAADPRTCMRLSAYSLPGSLSGRLSCAMPSALSRTSTGKP